MMAGVFGLFPTVMTMGNRYVAFYDDNEMRERESRQTEWERETERWQSPQVDKFIQLNLPICLRNAAIVSSLSVPLATIINKPWKYPMLAIL